MENKYKENYKHTNTHTHTHARASHQVGKIKVSTGGDRNHGGPEQDPEG